MTVGPSAPQNPGVWPRLMRAEYSRDFRSRSQPKVGP